MFNTLRSVIIGTSVRTDNVVTDHFAIELIEDKINQADANLRAAKLSLAALIQRERSESKLLKALDRQIGDMESRAIAALNAGQDGLANEAATVIADMENERTLRKATVDRLHEKITRLQSAVAKNHRKIVELKQGAIAAQAMHQESKLMQSSIGGGSSVTAASEAQALIDRVLGKEDQFETSAVLTEIDEGLDGGDLANRMAAQGFGPSTKSTASDVLNRLTAKS